MNLRNLVFCVLVLAFVNAEFQDMTWEFKQNVTLYWPGEKEFRLENPFRGEYTAPNGNKIWMEMEQYAAAAHGGTHLDSPAHIGDTDVPDRWTVELIPVERLVGPLRVVNVASKAAQDRNYQVTVTDVTEHERSHGRIPKGAIVLMNSGWSAKWTEKASYLGDKYSDGKLSFPGWSKEAAEYLRDLRGVYGVGVDTPSLDHGPSPDFPVHRALFSAQIYGLENVAHVDKVPESGATLIAFPMKMAGASGGPCRIVAVWGGNEAVLNGAFSRDFSILILLLCAVLNVVFLKN